MNKKSTKSKLFDDLTLAYGLVKRMNGYCFCFTGDQELVRLGYILHTRQDVKPYITAKGKKFLMDILKPLAENIPEDKPKQDENKKKAQELVEKLKNKPKRAYFEPQLDDEDDDEDEEEEEVKVKKKELDKPENDAHS